MREGNWILARRRERLVRRAEILQQVRAFFTRSGYLEVETPQRIPGNAPETYIDPVASGRWVLQTSPELAMKRLLAAGYERLFQLCKVWRDGERGSRHLPEFTMLEWYQSGADYTTLMDECEALLATLVPGGVLHWQGRRIDLAPPWPRLTVREAFSRYASRSLDEALAEGRFDEIMSLEIEPQLDVATPLFLTEYPAEFAALARVKPDDTSVAERFELYLAGMELANAFSELTDPVEQRRRFKQERAARRAAGKAVSPLPERFLDELQSLGECAGIALGIDRLVMLLTDAERIDQVVAFTAEEL